MGAHHGGGISRSGTAPSTRPAVVERLSGWSAERQFFTAARAAGLSDGAIGAKRAGSRKRDPRRPARASNLSVRLGRPLKWSAAPLAGLPAERFDEIGHALGRMAVQGEEGVGQKSGMPSAAPMADFATRASSGSLRAGGSTAFFPRSASNSSKVSL